MEGTISSFLPSKGYGFLRGDDGRDYFLHCNDIAEAQAVVEGQRVAFEESTTPKGYRARCVRPVALTGAARYVLPGGVLTSRSATIKGWEVLVRSHWLVAGSSRDSPEAAMRMLRDRAHRIGATAVLEVEYSKTRGSEPGTGHGTHYFTIHHFDGRPVVIGKPSVHGTHPLGALMGLDGQAAKLKRELVGKTRQSRVTATLVAACMLAVAGSMGLVVGGIIGLFVFLFAAIVSIMAWSAIAKDHDSWLALDD
ncbi:cold-shock protein [Rhodanobacter sp. Si-c]|uniref:Cold-shock protein n=1 Tax=Rhodanobacter lycopersici TaxID=3162487 RepID=A0ABV3QIZ4_9GAMM